MILDLQGIDAPKLGEIDYIGFPGKGIAAFLQNFRLRITSGQSACTAEEFNEYRRMIGKSMGEMISEILNQIVTKYPELKPDQLR